VWAVSTHVQPTTTREDGTIDQAGDLADLVTELERSAPVLLGGDFNFEPDTPSFQRLLDAGLSDVLAEDRPLPTWPSAEPVQQIDHLFTTSGLSRLSGTAPGYADTLASDHLPVGARLRVAP
jgi:endonuclease/exonuclease/phosphatase family metal-dependent hydrolase